MPRVASPSGPIHPQLLALLALAGAFSSYRMSHLDFHVVERKPTRFRAVLQRFGRETEGATLIEYGLLVLLIGVLCVVAIKTLGSGINNTLNSAGNGMP
jgi:pilus assembly protein Flp/PilA